jgi:hypothetical protein
VGEGGDEVSVARFIADQRTNYRVPRAFTCRVLEVSEAWFYKWIKSPVTARAARRAELDTAVKQAFDASGKAHGSPRLVEAFDLAVGLWVVGAGVSKADAAGVQGDLQGDAGAATGAAGEDGAIVGQHGGRIAIAGSGLSERGPTSWALNTRRVSLPTHSREWSSRMFRISTSVP